MAAIIACYSVLSAWQFWRGRDNELIFRLPVVTILLVHAAFFLIRIPFADALPLPTDSEEERAGWWIFITFEAVFFSFYIPYLLGGMAKERTALEYQHDSLIDSLTGVGNRRTFLERGVKVLHRNAVDHRPTALLMFDLDRFKTSTTALVTMWETKF